MSDTSPNGQAGMRRVSLVEGAIVTSQIGYGTSTLMGRIPARASRRILDAAFAAGITHFDTARSYGYGEAERALGVFMRGKRDRITVATKAGIVPPARSTSMSLLRSAARAAVVMAPGLRRALRRTAAKTVATGRFDPASIRASLETSLRELSTDFVDVFLLHECVLGDLTDELFEALQGFVTAGKVRAFGVATQVDISREIVACYGRFAMIVQVANSLEHPMRLPSPTPTVITHSIFKGNLKLLSERIAESCNRARFGSPLPGLARRAMLEYALRSNPRGITLFSSTNLAHIEENAENANQRIFADRELDLLADFFHSDCGDSKALS